ncbi:MAG: CPBP family intramembrane glutamic endopeptidase [Gemmatimonadales bacterium]
MSTQFTGRPSLALVTALSLGNAVFEEFLWLGLGIAVLRQYSVGLACVTSIGLRTLVHAYQGPLALVAVLPLGVVFTVYYLRSQRLWPVVLAHAFQDLLVLGYLALRGSGRGAV